MNNATITTDASFYIDHKVGGYAFWISTDFGHFKQSGIFKNKVHSSLEAEIQTIINALFFLSQFKKDWYAIRINTDALYAKYHLDKSSKNLKFLRYSQIFNSIKKEIKWRKFKINHIKAHTHNQDARSYVNAWCDLEAKKQVKYFLSQNNI